MDEKSLVYSELRKKFEEMDKMLKNTNEGIAKLRNSINEEQLRAQQIMGALQILADLMAKTVGKEEAQKDVDNIQGR